MKKHKIKRERPEPSGSYSREQEEHDLAYYIHDRVELMHQVFSALKPKDLKAMTPACIKHLSIDNIKELCTEELLGISSKRLCAILDGAEPPTDTESSLSASPERLETISLDSISSDEEILSEASKKNKKKHRHKEKSKKKKQFKSNDDEGGDKSKATRAGLTVLELLELQARARAIRAQLQKEQANKQVTETVESSHNTSSDDEVLVKEEPPEVVEISSDDEKPSIAELEKDKQNTSTETEKSDTVTKRVNNLVITVPQSKPSRKIKLNRTKSNPAPAEKGTTRSEPAENPVAVENNKSVGKTNNVATVASKAAQKDAKVKDKLKKKQKKKGKKKTDDNGSDHDEITLQLSDSEKLDLLEDLDQKNFDRVSSQTSEDSESSSSSSESDDDEQNGGKDALEVNHKHTAEEEFVKENNVTVNKQKSVEESKQAESNAESTDVNKDASKQSNSKIVDSSEEVSFREIEISDAKCGDVDMEALVVLNDKIEISDTKYSDVEMETSMAVNDKTADKESPDTITITEEPTSSVQSKSDNIEESVKVCEVDTVQQHTVDVQITEEQSQYSNKSSDSTSEKDTIKTVETTTTTEIPKDTNETVETNTASEISKVANADTDEISSDKVLTSESKDSTSEINSQDKNEDNKQMSEGELSDRDSSEVEATEVQPEVVCISDDEGKSKKSKKKHKKKEKKNKKEKKSKKDKSDFRNGSDQNFYKDNESSVVNTNISKNVDKINITNEPIVIDEDDIYEILELSDDSSCYEVEGTVLSKEPTAEEIEALSAKIDEIERVDIVTGEEIREHEQCLTENNEIDSEINDVEQISWKDRYLGSTKVKKVLTTANILNALRKKNKELKQKMEESKAKDNEDQEIDKVEKPTEAIESNLEEGSMEQYNTLQGSTKYVDPVKDPEINTEENEKETAEGKDKDTAVTNEMKKDAKQLLKMYKKLLKYNDMHKQKDPNKKKKKKQKKKKDSDNVASVVNNGI